MPDQRLAVLGELLPGDAAIASGPRDVERVLAHRRQRRTVHGRDARMTARRTW
jgi:hypothetical protein